MKVAQTLVILASLLTLLLTSGCAKEPPPPPPPPEPPPAAPVIEWQESTDPSCSYFYFLWGSSAEYKEEYAEALEAYEKAGICDPDAEYVAEKIPLLLIQLGRLEEAGVWLENYIAEHPDKMVQRFMLARLKILEGKESEAIGIYRQGLEIDPDNTNIQLRLALLYGKNGQYDTAEEILKAILEKDANSYFAVLYLARLYVETGKMDLAEERYLHALTLNWSKELSFEIADFYSLAKEFAKAREVYEDLLKRDTRDERAALGLVQTHLLLDQAEEALAELTRIGQFSKEPEQIDLVRSQILINLGKIDEAKAILAALQETSLTQARYLLGLILVEEEKYDEAAAALKDIPPSAPEFRDSIMLRLKMFEDQGRSEQSITLLRNLLLSERTRQPPFYSWLAAIHHQRDNLDKALQTLADGIRIYPNDESLLYENAILLEKKGDHEEAMALMEKILSLNRNHADALNFIGYSWADRNVNLQKAREYIEKALDIKPESGYIRDSLGWVYYRQGDYDQARIELHEAAELEPEDGYIHEHLGDTYRAMDDSENALLHYRKSLQLLTDEKAKKAIQQKIEQLNDL